MGYDLRGLNSSVELENLHGQDFIPDFLLIRKSYENHQRIWKLERMEIEGAEKMVQKGKKGQ